MDKIQEKFLNSSFINYVNCINRMSKKLNRTFPLVNTDLLDKLKSIIDFGNKIKSVQDRNLEIYNKLTNIYEKSIILTNKEIIETEQYKNDTDVIIQELKTQLENEKEKQKQQELEIQKLQNYINSLETQSETNNKCIELHKLANFVKRNPLYTTKQIAQALNKSEATINTQFREVCEKLFKIPDYEHNKGIKRVRRLITSSNI